MRAIFVVLLGLSATPALAGWQQEISSYDMSRLAKFDQAKAEGLLEAQAARPRERNTIEAVLRPEPRPASEGAILGRWNCRMMKLGGLAPAIIYDWFTCRVRETRYGLFFEKTTGTQRISGYLDRYEDGRFILLGATTVKNERRKPYSGGNFGVGVPAPSSDAMGLFSMTGTGRARVEFPYPILESTFDVIELRR